MRIGHWTVNYGCMIPVLLLNSSLKRGCGLRYSTDMRRACMTEPPKKYYGAALLYHSPSATAPEEHLSPLQTHTSTNERQTFLRLRTQQAAYRRHNSKFNIATILTIYSFRELFRSHHPDLTSLLPLQSQSKLQNQSFWHDHGRFRVTYPTCEDSLLSYLSRHQDIGWAST